MPITWDFNILSSCLAPPPPGLLQVSYFSAVQPYRALVGGREGRYDLLLAI